MVTSRSVDRLISARLFATESHLHRERGRPARMPIVPRQTWRIEFNYQRPNLAPSFTAPVDGSLVLLFAGGGLLYRRWGWMLEIIRGESSSIRGLLKRLSFRSLFGEKFEGERILIFLVKPFLQRQRLILLVIVSMLYF